MANRRKTKAQRELEGTMRNDRDYGEPGYPEPQSIEPPDDLIGPDAVKMWEKYTRVLSASRVLSDADLEMLLHLCNLHASILKKWRAGVDPTASMLTQLRLMASEFGLTPASRSKANELGEGGKVDPTEKFFAGPKLA